MSHRKRPIERIACVGEVMIELIAGDDGSARWDVAGDTYNTAVYLARLLRESSVSTSYITTLGDDLYSDRIMRQLEHHGLETQSVERRKRAMPGLYAIDTDADGERSFSYWRSHSAARRMFSTDSRISIDDLNEFDLVYLSGISLAILPRDVRAELLDWAKTFSDTGGTLAYDSNHRPQLWESPEAARATNEAMWRRADVALPSVDDEMLLYGDTTADDVAERLRQWGVSRGALKRGNRGPLDLSGAHGKIAIQTGPVSVIDTTAAGDSFNAGYLGAVALGEDAASAMLAGHNLACRVIGVRGAIIPET